jgi:hypothetical protein
MFEPASTMNTAGSSPPSLSRESLPPAGTILALAAGRKYETPCINTHRLDGRAMDFPLTMSGNL